MYKYTKKGQRYTERIGPRDYSKYNSDDGYYYSHVQTENNKPDVPLFAKLDTIESHYGKGVKSYFTYVNFIIVINFIYVLCGVISWGMFMNENKNKFEFQDFIITNYIKNVSDKYWFWTNCTVLILCFFSGMFYYIFDKISAKCSTGNEQGYMTLGHHDTKHLDDYIFDNSAKKTRYLISIGLTTFSLTLTISIFAGILLLERNLIARFGDVKLFYNISLSVVFNFLTSFIFVLCNAIWKYMSIKLTDLENNPTWSKYRISQSLKLIIFKLVSAIMLFILISVILNPLNDCMDTQYATNFFFIVVIDAFVINFIVEICVPLVGRSIRKCLNCDEKEKPEFNISEELQQLFYRQFILNLGFIVFPMLSGVGFVGMLCQYVFDRIKLKYVCSDPHYVDNSFLLFFVISSVILAFLTLIAFPNGFLWMGFLPKLLPEGFQNCSMTGAINRL